MHGVQSPGRPPGLLGPFAQLCVSQHSYALLHGFCCVSLSPVGLGLFVEGEVPPGALIALFPGLAYGKDVHRCSDAVSKLILAGSGPRVWDMHAPGLASDCIFQDLSSRLLSVSWLACIGHLYKALHCTLPRLLSAP
jgi:hypothetical protein